MTGSGQTILDDEKRDRLRRMIEALRFDLMTRHDIQDREEAVARLKRWEKELNP
jgi:DNA-binding IclR family transcriptional regulator